MHLARERKIFRRGAPHLTDVARLGNANWLELERFGEEEGCFALRRGENCAPDTLAKYWTNLLVPRNDVRSQECYAASPVIEARPGVRIGIGTHALRSKRKKRGKFQCFVRGQARHREEILLSGCNYYISSSLIVKYTSFIAYEETCGYVSSSSWGQILAALSLPENAARGFS
jgi:hypothetical protein